MIWKSRSRSSSRPASRRNSRVNNCKGGMDRFHRNNPTFLPIVIMISLYILITVMTIGAGPFTINSSPSSPESSSETFALPDVKSNHRPNVHNRHHGKDASSSYKYHSIVFDAGSTGTRIHVFTFRITDLKDGQKKVKLLHEDFKQVKPGLSAYADEPREAALSLLPLLEVAFNRIPVAKRSSTPLVVKATAGLRLLPGDQAESIIREVDGFLRSLDHPFKMDDDNSVGIMDGEDEGIFGWFTINFLLNMLQDDFNSVAHLDLGGGSTQITFTPTEDKSVSDAPNEFIVSKNIIGLEKRLYTHSYLGFGLMSSRKGILRRALHNTTIEASSEDNVIRVSHPCFPEGTKTSWTFEGRTYLIEGVVGDCYKIARDFVNNEGSGNEEIFDKPIELSQRQIYAISYYYDRASDVGLINGTENGGLVRVKDYYLAAKMFCGSMFDKLETNSHRRVNTRQDQRFIDNFMQFNDAGDLGINGIYSENPFVCLDLSYIANILNAGYGLSWHKQISVVKKLRGVESSWALGAGVNLIR